MACYRPLEAYQHPLGGQVYISKGGVPAARLQGRIAGMRALELPCGRCIGCRITRQRAWALRCLHESQLHKVSCFVTLTYNELLCPPGLVYKGELGFQRFMYRVRERLGPTRFFMCGEYGETTFRPHYHAILFGRSFPDGVPVGNELFTSKILGELWPHGFSTFGAVNYQTAAYVAGYCVKKLSSNDPRYEERYKRVDWRTGEIVSVAPEFAKMSLRPGIGAPWFDKYWREVYGPRDGVVQQGGKLAPPPRYYDKLLARLNYDLADSKFYDRYVRAEAFAKDCTEDRLKVREIVATARLAQRSRKL